MALSLHVFWRKGGLLLQQRVFCDTIYVYAHQEGRPSMPWKEITSVHNPAVQALRELPCRLTIEYTPCDGALIFRDYSLAVRREIIRTVKDVCRERGHELTVLLDETQE